jgi:hypothetical protein
MHLQILSPLRILEVFNTHMKFSILLRDRERFPRRLSLLFCVVN